MNKNFKTYLVIWAIGLAMFNLIAFLIPGDNRFDEGFFLGYIFITLAYILQLGVGYFTFKEENLSKVFLNIPTIKFSFGSMILTIVVSLFTMIADLPVWLGAILCFCSFGIGAIATLVASSAGDIVGGIDDQIKTQTFFIKALTIDMNTLVAQSPSPEVRVEVTKVYEAVRYSDPKSNAALAPSEAQITIKFNQLSQAVLANDVMSVRAFANDMLILIQDRNNKCRLLK